MNPVPLILASSSPRRLQLLQQIGIVPSAADAPEIDETPLHGELPLAYTLRLAEAKARAVAPNHQGAIILAGDTVVAKGRRILPKAETEEQARHCLKLLSGCRHQVISTIAVMRGDDALRLATSQSIVRFQRLTQSDMDNYIASGEWQGKAGGYAIQGLAAQYVAWISGSYSGIVGLPLHETTKLLEWASSTKFNT